MLKNLVEKHTLLCSVVLSIVFSFMTSRLLHLEEFSFSTQIILTVLIFTTYNFIFKSLINDFINVFINHEFKTNFILNNKILGEVFKIYYKVRYGIKKNNIVNYYIVGEFEIDYVKEILNDINNLDERTKFILKNNPLPIIFAKEKDRGNDPEYYIYGTHYRSRKKGIKSSLIVIRDNDNRVHRSKDVIVHELCHHIDMVYCYATENKPSKRYTDYVGWDYIPLFTKNKLDLSNYFHSSFVEFYAETLKMYLLNELDYNELADFYDNQLNKIVYCIESNNSNACSFA